MYEGALAAEKSTDEATKTKLFEEGKEMFKKEILTRIDGHQKKEATLYVAYW